MPNYTKENAISLRVDAHILKFFIDNPDGFVDKFRSDVFERTRSGKQNFDDAFQTVLDDVRGHLRPQAANLPAVKSDDVINDLGAARTALRTIRDSMDTEYSRGIKHNASYYSDIARIKVARELSTASDRFAPIAQIENEAAAFRAQNIAELTKLAGPEIARAARSLTTSVNNDHVEALLLAQVAKGVAEKGSWQEFFEANGGGLISASDQQKYSGQLNRALADAKKINKENNYGFSAEDIGNLARVAIDVAHSKGQKVR